MRWAGGVRCSSHPLFCVVSLPLPLVSAFLSYRTGSVLSEQNSSTHKLFHNPLSKMYFLFKIVALILSRLRCNRHCFLLNTYLSRVGKIENSSCSIYSHPTQYTSHFIRHCPGTEALHCSFFGDFYLLYDLWSRL